MTVEHKHDHHDHDHSHHHPHPETFWSARAKALESLLIEKGILSSDAIDSVVQRYENEIGPMNGAKVVAKAWTDAAFKQRLLQDPLTELKELGFYGLQGEHVRVLENTDAVHNVVCCTLCSCYPWTLLGLPPAWYKEPAYRSRIVKEPREVLREFGLELPDTTELRVWDSSAEMRYLVLPQRPPGTESMSEDELAAIVTRDSMIGVVQVQPPAVTA
ncbi:MULTISPECIES: nitrile hydratase subunit alpha [unclassified Paenibacillus]|uniref:nitrile hydratase subunit alpha n=1 Tax=unclassified Paenibacillus TaxID=185978 RepID=UPI001AEAD7FA|nr:MULTISPECIES: nitrile hydratase subunit alpha [unclassified Paenibacillus]MBP1155599.1 nitrile hydratase [Paenibacillus sp. PvP091]MBP1169015.1 nitrile hydratase [Paenibacillus sp. PvR098]MBP2440043.1 nitrile hydratase [Paenibacillus sp. PvP052]